MLFVFDIFDRCQIQYFILGDISRQLRDQEPGNDYVEADKVEVGVMRGSLTGALYALLKDYMPTFYREINDKLGKMKRIEFEYNGIPVIVKIFDKDYGVFSNLDLRFYDVEQVYLPNPFEIYWQKRGIL